MRFLARTLFAAGSAFALAACASVLGIDDPVVDLGLDGSAGDGAVGDALDATGADVVQTQDAGDASTSDAARSADSGARDGEVDAVAEASCGIAPDDAVGVFVDIDATGDAGTCGDTRNSPCKTIQAGLERAVSLNKPFVYVARGNYVESITLHAGKTVLGGWEVSGTTWSSTCGNAVAAVTITAPTTANITVLADALGGSAKLDTLSIRSKSTNVGAGESLYGIFARGSTTNLTLANVDVMVSQAGDGVTGAAGTAGAGGGNDCTPASTGTSPAPGTAGTAAVAGSFATTGYVPTAGGTGSAGGRGENGTAPVAPACVSCVSCGGALCSSSPNGTSCGQPGKSGCGGDPGTGGLGGSGGGSSVAIYVTDATVTVGACALTTANGGAGGAGGTPGPGGDGGIGANGTPGNQCGIHCNGNALNCLVDQFAMGDGGAGTKGGNGSGGGVGGGGSGGWSCSVVKIGASAAVNGTCAGGTLGNGGNGAGGAPNGLAKSVCP